MKKHKIEHLHKIAKNKSGKCLSKKYKNIFTKYKWQCSKKHKWWTSYNHILHDNSWCRKCEDNKHSLKLKKAIECAKKNKGKCLSKKYKDNKTKLRWECEKNHRWSADLRAVLYNNTWCKKCEKLKKLNEIKIIARKRSGMCLSKNYKDIYSRLKFKCVNNHIWSTTARNVIRGSWCNKCHFYYSEEICRTTFQQIFKKKFPKSRPSWLIGAKGYTMELDGYNEKLRVAFEYQGEQHFKKDDYFTGKNLKDIILSDKLKANLCASKKVNLIIITYKDDLIDLPKKIKKNINRNLNIYKNLDFDKNIDFNKIYSHKPKILVLKSFAKKLGGKCLSNKYVNNRTYMKWECAEGHQWPAPSSRILYGKWCRKCFLEKRKKI